MLIDIRERLVYSIISDAMVPNSFFKKEREYHKKHSEDSEARGGDHHHDPHGADYRTEHARCCVLMTHEDT